MEDYKGLQTQLAIRAKATSLSWPTHREGTFKAGQSKAKQAKWEAREQTKRDRRRAKRAA